MTPPQDLTDDDLGALILDTIRTGDIAAFHAFTVEADRRREERDRRLSAPGALASAAVWYATKGIAVFPVRPRGKEPYPGSRGFKDATTNLDQVRRWWTERPNSNIGLPTGDLFDVIDVDGEQGARSYRELLLSKTLPATYGCATTGRPCSRHLYIRPTGDGCATDILPGLDYRGRGGYVVAPPSIGETGRRYDWVTPLDLTALKAGRGTQTELIDDAGGIA
jgi:hypothetical protein